jgi:hypothetical protein
MSFVSAPLQLTPKVAVPEEDYFQIFCFFAGIPSGYMALSYSEAFKFFSGGIL